jgi:hypothetical protein
MKKYVNRFVVSLLICTILINGFNDKEYNLMAEENNVEIENLEQFIDSFSIIPEEVKEFMESDFTLLNIDLSEELQRFTYDTCEKYDMDYMYVLSVMATESEFKSKAKSKNQVGGGHSISYMQLNNQYIEWYIELTGIKDFNIWNEKHNIEGGIAVLKFYRDYWKNNVEDISEEELWYFALNSYNMGINGFKSYVRDTGEISRHYDRKVMKNKIKLEQGGY